MDIREESLAEHYKLRGKISTALKAPLETKHDLSVLYTPGVAEPCLEIQKDVSKSFLLTGRWNTVAVVTDGTAVLGLGDIGPEAGMPVMEGKCVLFKKFGDGDAVPICIRSKDVDVIVETVANIAGSFGGINLEDISAPRCFEIERRLKERLDIPVFHDDQHGTAVVVLAALINSLKAVGKEKSSLRVVINGCGAAGSAIAKLLLSFGVGDVVICDRRGIVCRGREGLNPEKEEMAGITNKENISGTLADAMRGTDVFIGVSAPGAVSKEMVRSMNASPIVFAMANPTPEIMPDEAIEAGAVIVGTGRSDFPNQINNVLAFPGIFRGAIDVGAKQINEEMKLAAAHAIAGAVSEEDIARGVVIPDPFNREAIAAVAEAVARAAKDSGAV